jgi:hypothetical protein
MRTPISGTSWESWCDLVRSWEQRDTSEVPLNTQPSAIDMLRRGEVSFLRRCYLKYTKNTCRNLRITSSLNKKLNILYRTRASTQWLDKKVGPCDLHQYMTNKLFGFSTQELADDYTPEAFISASLHDEDDLEEIKRVQVDLSLTRQYAYLNSLTIFTFNLIYI